MTAVVVRSVLNRKYRVGCEESVEEQLYEMEFGDSKWGAQQPHPSVTLSSSSELLHDVC